MDLRGMRAHATIEGCPADVAFGYMRCIVGGGIRKPLPLPVHVHKNVEMLRLGEKDCWLRMMMHVHACELHRDFAVREVLRVVTSLLRNAQEERRKAAQRNRLFDEDEDGFAACPDHDPGSSDGSAACPDHDPGSSDGSAQLPTVLRRAQTMTPAARPYPVRGGTVEQVTWGDLTFRVMMRYGVLYAEASPELCRKLVAAGEQVVKNIDELPIPPHTNKRPFSSGCAPGRLNWIAPLSSWQVTFTNKEGHRSSTRKGLSVPLKTVSGQALSEREREEWKAMLFERAKNIWDALDCSSGPRFRDGG